MLHEPFETRLEDLRRAEYGSHAETVIRYTIMAGVVAVLSVVFDSGLVLIWGTVYFLLEGSMACVVHVPRLGSAPFRYLMALGLYMMSGVSFIAMAIYLVAANLSPALSIAGIVGMVGLLLHSLQRPQREAGLVVADCLLVVIMTLALLTLLRTIIEGWGDWFFVLFILSAGAAYYIGSLISGWRQQQSLREAQQRYANAQKARALGQFVGGVAHDFNNQLTAIMGNLELFDELDNPEDRANALRDSRTAAEHAAMTVQQLLISSGRTRLSPEPLSMEAFLQDLKELLANLLDPEMTITVASPAEQLVASVDRDMLETSVIQLCLNAQDATRGHGQICLSVASWTTVPKIDPPPEANPPYVALTVEDDGPGVPAEALPLLAEPFYSSKPRSEGRGLGLSAVAGFARQSGGALIMQSTPVGHLRAIILLPEA